MLSGPGKLGGQAARAGEHLPQFPDRQRWGKVCLGVWLVGHGSQFKLKVSRICFHLETVSKLSVACYSSSCQQPRTTTKAGQKLFLLASAAAAANAPLIGRLVGWLARVRFGGCLCWWCNGIWFWFHFGLLQKQHSCYGSWLRRRHRIAHKHSLRPQSCASQIRLRRRRRNQTRRLKWNGHTTHANSIALYWQEVGWAFQLGPHEQHEADWLLNILLFKLDWQDLH